MNELIQNQKEELKDLIYKAPALITLYSVNHRGESLGPSEEKAAIIYLSILCNQGPEELQDFFVDVKKTFQECLSKLDKSLPKGEKERKAEIEEQLLPVKHFINTLPINYKTIFKEALLGFLTHARGFVGDTLESVVLPFISDNLRKIENERMRWIL